MYGTVRTVVWEDGRGDSPSYPIPNHGLQKSPLPSDDPIYRLKRSALGLRNDL